MNNKGFAITGILYGLMLIFILVLSSFLSVLIGKNRRIDELENNIYINTSVYSVGVNIVDINDLYSDGVSYSFNNFDYKISTLDNRVNNNSYIKNINILPEYIYTTKRNALYFLSFNNNSNKCEVFLPKNTVVISGSTKGNGADINKLYYKIGGSSNLDDFTELECIR